MPTTPVYGGQKVNEGGMPGVRANTNASAADYGGGVAQGVAQLGGAVSDLGVAMGDVEQRQAAIIERARLSASKSKASEQALRYNAELGGALGVNIAKNKDGDARIGFQEWNKTRDDTLAKYRDSFGDDQTGLAMFDEERVKYTMAKDYAAEEHYTTQAIDHQDRVYEASVVSGTKLAGESFAMGQMPVAEKALSDVEKEIREHDALQNIPPEETEVTVQKARGDAAFEAGDYLLKRNTPDSLKRLAGIVNDPEVMGAMSLAQRGKLQAAALTQAEGMLSYDIGTQAATNHPDSVVDQRDAVHKYAKENGLGATWIKDANNVADEHRAAVAKDQQKLETNAQNEIADVVKDGKSFTQFSTEESYTKARPELQVKMRAWFESAKESYQRTVNNTGNNPSVLADLIKNANNPTALTEMCANPATRAMMTDTTFKDVQGWINDPHGKEARDRNIADDMAKDVLRQRSMTDSKLVISDGVPKDGAYYDALYRSLYEQMRIDMRDPESKRAKDPAAWTTFIQEKSEAFNKEVSPAALLPYVSSVESPTHISTIAGLKSPDKGARIDGLNMARAAVKTNAAQGGKLATLPSVMVAATGMSIEELTAARGVKMSGGLTAEAADYAILDESQVQWQTAHPDFAAQLNTYVNAGWDGLKKWSGGASEARAALYDISITSPLTEVWKAMKGNGGQLNTNPAFGAVPARQSQAELAKRQADVHARTDAKYGR